MARFKKWNPREQGLASRIVMHGHEERIGLLMRQYDPKSKASATALKNGLVHLLNLIGFEVQTERVAP